MARWLRRSSEGITAAVGTLLMIVVLVAMSTGLSVVWKAHVADAMAQHTPPMGFVPDDGRDVAVVVRLAGDLDWARHVSFLGTCTPTLNGGPFPAAEGTPVREGDELGCAPGERLVVVVNDTVLYRHDFG